jgi:hypothetical protein
MLELEEEEQADDICDDRYEEDPFARDAEEEGAEAEDERRDKLSSPDDTEEDLTQGDSCGYAGQSEDDQALGAQGFTERVYTLCSKLGLPSSGTREQICSRLVSYLQTEYLQPEMGEMAEPNVYSGEEEGCENELTNPLLPLPPSTRQPGQTSAQSAEAPDCPSHRPPAIPEAVDATPSGEAARLGTTAGGKRPRAFGSLASSNLKVDVSGPDLGASFRSDDSDRPKTARGQPGVDPFHYVSPSKVRPTSAPRVRSAAGRAAMMPKPIQRLTISTATPPACSPLGSPFDPAIASADEAFAIEDDDDEEDDQIDMIAQTST